MLAGQTQARQYFALHIGLLGWLINDKSTKQFLNNSNDGSGPGDDQCDIDIVMFVVEV